MKGLVPCDDRRRTTTPKNDALFVFTAQAVQVLGTLESISGPRIQFSGSVRSEHDAFQSNPLREGSGQWMNLHPREFVPPLSGRFGTRDWSHHLEAGTYQLQSKICQKRGSPTQITRVEW